MNVNQYEPDIELHEN